MSKASWHIVGNARTDLISTAFLFFALAVNVPEASFSFWTGFSKVVWIPDPWVVWSSVWGLRTWYKAVLLVSDGSVTFYQMPGSVKCSQNPKKNSIIKRQRKKKTPKNKTLHLLFYSFCDLLIVFLSNILNWELISMGKFLVWVIFLVLGANKILFRQACLT